MPQERQAKMVKATQVEIKQYWTYLEQMESGNFSAGDMNMRMFEYDMKRKYGYTDICEFEEANGLLLDDPLGQLC